jgi:hypothetical protein
MNTSPKSLESGPLPMPSVDDDRGVLSAEARGALAMMAGLGPDDAIGVDVAVDRFGMGIIGELVILRLIEVDASGAVLLTAGAAAEVVHFDRLRELAEVCMCGRDQGEHLVEFPHGTEDGSCHGFAPAYSSPATRDTMPAPVNIVELASYRAPGGAAR